jgi:anaerobic ribonucleoside-triphosphate reductase activating protein
MNYGNIYYMSIVDGPGNRVSLYVSGCRNHCQGCFNEETWNFNYGKPFTEIEVNEIIEACKKSYISGLSILGGDPFEPENQAGLVGLISRFKNECPDKTLWMYTGYIYEQDLKPGQRNHIDGVTSQILDAVDVLVDGPFIQAQRDLDLQFRGSRNQRLLSKADRVGL